MTTQVLILPGYQNSDEPHWQTRWERVARGVPVQRVMQADWQTPSCDDWYAQLSASICASPHPVVLVAHSLGCLLTAHLMRVNDKSVQDCIKGALLVAPPDPNGPHFPQSAHGFWPTVAQPARFLTTVVASNDDPYGSIEFAQSCATSWGSQWVALNRRGHINGASGLGDWDEGWALIEPWLLA